MPASDKYISLELAKRRENFAPDRLPGPLLASQYRTGAGSSIQGWSPGARAMLCLIGHALIENRAGLIVQGDLTQADGHAERRTAHDMIHRHAPGSTKQLKLGADRGFDAAGFVADLRQACVTPHVARRSRCSAIDRCTTRHESYGLSQKHRKRIEEAFR